MRVLFHDGTAKGQPVVGSAYIGEDGRVAFDGAAIRVSNVQIRALDSRTMLSPKDGIPFLYALADRHRNPYFYAEILDDDIEKSFNPQQPRDKRGQWTKGGVRRMSRQESVKELVDNQRRVSDIDREYAPRMNGALGVRVSYVLSPGDIAQAYQQLDTEQRQVVDSLKKEIAAKKKPYLPRQAWDESGSTLTGIHFSAHTLTETDPLLQGTGRPGQERRRFVDGRNATGGMVSGFVPYTNFYLADSSSAIEDRFLGDVAHITEPIPKEKIWDMRKGNKSYSELHKKGYHGAYYPDVNQLHMFVPVKVNTLGKIRHLPSETLITGDMVAELVEK